MEKPNAGDMKGASKDFLESNSLVTKFVFIIGLLILFLAALRFFISVGAWLFMESPTPHFTDGITNTDTGFVISVNPNKSNSTPVLRSVNEREGLEFTYSIWLYVKEPPTEEKCIFRKGPPGGKVGATREKWVSNGPGLYIVNNNNEAQLTAVMDYYESTGQLTNKIEIIGVKIPVRSWVNVMVRCNNKNLDILINGVLNSSTLMPGVPKQNYYDIQFSGGGAGKEPFKGFISDFWYWNYSLGTNAIMNLVKNGPNIKNLKKTQTMDGKVPKYLAYSWFMN